MHFTEDIYRLLSAKMDCEQRKRMAGYTEVKKAVRTEPRRPLSRIAIMLSWPPSANRIWRVGRGKNYLSPKYKAFKRGVESTVKSAFPKNKRPILSGKFAVSITLYPPTRRKRDIDNCVKPILDALTSAGVWRDDEDVWEIHIRRDAVRKGGGAYVKIEPYNENAGKRGKKAPE